MSKVKIVAILLLIGLVVLPLCAAQKASSSGSPPPPATEGWQKEFEEVCSQTQDAMTFSIAELKSFVQRCDALLPKIEKLDETQRKVYLRRVGQCRGLFAYVLDSKQKGKK